MVRSPPDEEASLAIRTAADLRAIRKDLRYLSMAITFFGLALFTQYAGRWEIWIVYGIPLLIGLFARSRWT